MSASLPPDEVLEALLLEVETATPGSVEADAVAARHGVDPQLVRDLLTSLHVLNAEATPGEGNADRLGPYELLEVLGSGGMGRVYRARHPGLEREVALKVMRSGSAATPHQRARFLREAEVLAALRHPNVVGVHTAGQTSTGSYLVLELVEGARPITAAREGLDWRGRVALVRDAARGLGYAHTQGVVHRDVKPDNLLVDAEGRVRVTDFGLARMAETERLTQTGALLGTVGYMAPEQARGETRRQGPASDVWALGLVLFELLTGRALFPASESKLADLEARARPATLPALRADLPDLPLDLERVWRRALAHDPEDRYPDGDALAADLDAVLSGEAPPGVSRGGSARRLLAAVALVGALALLARTSVDRQDAPDPAPPPPTTPTRSAAPTPTAGGRAPWRSLAQGSSRAEEALAARRWLRANPAHSRARSARALLTEARRAPLCVLEHALGGERLVAVAFDGPAAVVTSGAGRLARWSFPGGAVSGSWPVQGLHGAARLTGGDWILSGAGALERWPADALTSSASALTGRLGRPRAEPGATWIRPWRRAADLAKLSPDEAWAVARAGPGLALVDARTGAARAVAVTRRSVARHFAFVSPSRLVVARIQSARHRLELWDVASGELVTSQPSPAISALTFLARAGLLAVGSHRGTLTLHDPTTLEPQRSLGDPTLRNEAGSFVFSNDEAVAQVDPLPGEAALLALPGRDVPADDRALKRIELASGEARPVVKLSKPPYSLALSPDGSLVAIGYRDGRAEVWLLP